ncbi:MAG: hypothetical protein E6I34_03365 [Chloroflexi bacterium]|nr:MAG: hypothetical protein E6I34_03365 [Chloroflexota bacterium]
MLKKLLLGPAAALVLLTVSAAPALAASQVGRGSLFLDGRVVGTVVPPANMPAGTGQDPFYKVTNGASDQLGIAGVGPGDSGAFHGGSWQVWTVTFNSGVTPYLLTSASAVAAALAAGDVTVTRVPDADFRCPITQQH